MNEKGRPIIRITKTISGQEPEEYIYNLRFGQDFGYEFRNWKCGTWNPNDCLSLAICSGIRLQDERDWDEWSSDKPRRYVDGEFELIEPYH